MSKSLFERLGETEGITKIVDDAVGAHMSNPAISARFLPYLDTPEKLALVRQNTIDFFVAGSGGQVVYAGKDMPEAHRGMNINPSEYMYVMDDIMQTLVKHQIDDDTQKDVLAILWSLKDQIIAK